MSNDTSVRYDEATNTTTIVTSSTTEREDGLSSKQIGIIVGVLVAVLLITAVIVFFLLRRRASRKKSLKKPTGTSEVYADTTAPLGEEDKEMLKSNKNGAEQVELEVKPSEPENTTESSPLKENPSVPVANESSVVLVDDDGNAVA